MSNRIQSRFAKGVAGKFQRAHEPMTELQYAIFDLILAAEIDLYYTPPDIKEKQLRRAVREIKVSLGG